MRVGKPAHAESITQQSQKGGKTLAIIRENGRASITMNFDGKMALELEKLVEWPLLSQEELYNLLPFGGQAIFAKDPYILPFVKKDHDLIGKFLIITNFRGKK